MFQWGDIVILHVDEAIGHGRRAKDEALQAVEQFLFLEGDGGSINDKFSFEVVKSYFIRQEAVNLWHNSKHSKHDRGGIIGRGGSLWV